MSTTLSAADAVFDPQLSASLQNEILRRGWEGLETGLPFEESTATWWELHAHRVPEVSPGCPARSDTDRWIILYHATSLLSHLKQSITTDNTIVEEIQRPWVPLQDIFAAYLEMNDLGKIAIEDLKTAKDEHIRQNHDAIMAGTQAILDRTVTALGRLVDAIEKQMPSPKPKAEKTTGVMSMTSVAENLVSTGQATKDSFLVKFLRDVDGLLASAHPELLFIAPGLRLPNHDDLAMTQPFEGVEYKREYPPILIFRGELSSGRSALTTFPVGKWNPFLDPYQNHIKQASSVYPSGLWISKHNKENPNYDDSCRLLLPDQVVLAKGLGARHHAKTTDGFLLEQPPGKECEGLAAGLYQTSCNVFEGLHEVELFRVLEHWIQRVEDGRWDVDERGVAGGMEKWAEADESEAMAEKYRLPYTW